METIQEHGDQRHSNNEKTVAGTGAGAGTDAGTCAGRGAYVGSSWSLGDGSCEEGPI